MKLKASKKSACRKKCTPFFVLPVLTNETPKISDEVHLIMPNNPGLKLFTKTWPPKRENKKENERPLTATLEKPTILDIRYIGKIDMSLVQKDVFNFSAICRIPFAIKQKTVSRPLSLPSTKPKVRQPSNERKNENTDTSSWEDEESSILHSAKIYKCDILKKKFNNSVINCKKTRVKSTSDANNNNKTFKVLKKTSLRNAPLVASVGLNKFEESIKLPEPCTACGRPNQPERFHSHPASPAIPLIRRSAGRKMTESPKLAVKSTVQKPIAIKYKSKLNNNNINAKSKQLLQPAKAEPKSSIEAQKLSRSPEPPKVSIGKADGTTNKSTPVLKEPPQRVKSAKRTLTCYICGREFGTASLSLHEPKCLEKCERENAKFPVHLRRKLPIRPKGSITPEEWNQLAWESSQSSLAPCKNCGRTFYPDRLIVHQRSCKTPQNNIRVNLNEIPSPTPMPQTARSAEPAASSSPAPPPPSVQCYICGKLFGTHSIKIHERQCLKKWQAENDSLPPDMRSPTPTKNGNKTQTAESELEKSNQENLRSSSASKRPPLFPCYLCGKLFSVNSIYIHEPQCLKIWKIENDKLPANKRRPVPLKPDVKFTRNGSIDYELTVDSNWKSHLRQLVPCKHCGRTFNPDRVDVHERSCKGI